jgi:integrase
MKLTDARVKALKPRPKTYALFDEDLRGFGIRVSPRGTKSFTFVYRLNGRKKRLSLGKFPFVSLADARAEAHKALGAVKGERKDPRESREQGDPPKPGGLTVQKLTEHYLDSDRFKSAREASRHQFRTIIEDEIRPALGTRPLATVSPADLVDWSQGIIDRGAPTTANQSFKILRLVWNWARRRLVRHGVPPFPLAGYGKPWEGERPRKRHLSPDLMRRFVEAIDEEPRSTATWWLLMLLNLTRKTETCLLEKSEVIWESERGPYLIIPAEKSKNHQPLYQPLTDHSALLLRLAVERSGDSGWVMPGRKGKARFQRTGVPGSRVSRRIGARVSPHDLRHTVATMLGELGVEPHVIDALQNHKLPQSTQVTGTYNDALVWAYFTQKKEALQLWHQHLDRKILEGRLIDHIRQAVSGKKQFEEAMELNMKLGPHSEAHKQAVRRRSAALVRQRRSA